MVRKIMTVDEFDILIRAIHRESEQNPHYVQVVHESTFINGSKHHIFMALNSMWITLDGVEFKCLEPWYFSKHKKKYNEAIKLLNTVRGEYSALTAEALICASIPCAKDIIAEQKLLDDNKN